MEDDYKRIQKRALEDPGTAGDEGEENWAKLLKNWLPKTFHIVTKGRILSFDGKTSPQVDILILQPEYPPHLVNSKLYLAGAVLAAFECKVTLKAKHIEEFINRSIQVKHIPEKRHGTPHKELNAPILYGLLSHSHSWRENQSKPIDKIEGFLAKSMGSLLKHPIELPDLICMADLGCWSSLKSPIFGPVKFLKPDGSIEAQSNPDRQWIMTSLTSYLNEFQVKDFTPIGSFITNLLHKLAWEVNAMRSISAYFDSTGLKGDSFGGYLLRPWPLELYSPTVRRALKENHTIKTHKGWDEWSSVLY